MSKFDFEKYKGQKVVMHCKTEEEAKDFCRVMDEAGLCWYSGRTYKEVNNYDYFKERTCYNFKDGDYSGISFYKAEGFEILEWSDYMNNQFTKSNLRNGDVCVCGNGNVYVAVIETGTLLGRSGFMKLKDYDENLLRFDINKEVDFDYNINKVYRPKQPYQCQFIECHYCAGDLVFDRAAIETVEVTLEEIAKLKGVSVDRIKIVNG